MKSLENGNIILSSSTTNIFSLITLKTNIGVPVRLASEFALNKYDEVKERFSSNEYKLSIREVSGAEWIVIFFQDSIFGVEV